MAPGTRSQVNCCLILSDQRIGQYMRRVTCTVLVARLPTGDKRRGGVRGNGSCLRCTDELIERCSQDPNCCPAVSHLFREPEPNFATKNLMRKAPESRAYSRSFFSIHERVKPKRIMKKVETPISTVNTDRDGGGSGVLLIRELCTCLVHTSLCLNST